MDKGIYTALSGAMAKSHEIELIANNLANANTAGFKKDRATFNEYLTELRREDSVEGLQRDIKSSVLLEGRALGDKGFVELDGIYTDFGQGTVEKTGRDLDMALEGKGFLEVSTPAGIRYTRAGNLSLNADRVVVTSHGYPVLSRGQGDPASRLIRLREGSVEITPQGNLVQNGAQVGNISVQEFHEPQWLEKAGNGLFRNVHPDNLAPTLMTKVHQGFVENSNVNAVTEMTKLIEATRSYESHMQAIKAYQEMDGRLVNDLVRER